jgi:hypothetical protein
MGRGIGNTGSSDADFEYDFGGSFRGSCCDISYAVSLRCRVESR